MRKKLFYTGNKKKELTGYYISKPVRTVIQLEKGWKFTKGDPAGAERLLFNDKEWEETAVPHDWAIYGPFDENNDRQNVAILQNTEEVPSFKTGRTGGLPHIGTGWYRKYFSIAEKLQDHQKVLLQFDGAMSNAEVYINGEKAGSHPYGYSYFYFDITSYLKKGENLIAVRLENLEQASRWYPGAGLYRNVNLIFQHAEGFKQWSTFITTPEITAREASVCIRSIVHGKKTELCTVILNDKKNKVTSALSVQGEGNEIIQILKVKNPGLWSPENPYLYTAEMSLFRDEEIIDRQLIRFGIRSIKFSPEKGFELNGKVRKFRGVCLHHDSGPLGAAVSKAAVRRQLTIMKDMGCDSIRSAHNMPTPEMLEICDEMGFMFMAESFDEWSAAKMKNGYNLLFGEWAEKDIINLTGRVRNHPSVVMYSTGNEIPDQLTEEGKKLALYLQDIFHREDPTRPVTVGMDQVESVMNSGFGAAVEIPGLNYRVHLYEEAFEKFPQKIILGSETASTVSSRGVYKFPVKEGKMIMHEDLQCSSYDLEACSWSNIPDEDFALSDDRPWVIGQFVWTGFDYLGEPTPYDDPWPARSSYFGICDLGGIPKDRYFLYRSVWNKKSPTLHILPHWNWEGRLGQTVPVFVYTNFSSAELFLNGKSLGTRRKNRESRLERYRLTWMDVKYEPGQLKAVAYDQDGRPAAEKYVYTAGDPATLKLEADRLKINADSKDISFVTVSAVDKRGYFCPDADNLLNFKVSGEGVFKAACSGDATSLEQFHIPEMKLFSGKLVVLVQSTEKSGSIKLEAGSEGLKTAAIKIKTV